MSLLSLPVDERLEYLQDILSCSGTMYTWTYDTKGKLLKTNCEDLLLDKIFSSAGFKEKMLRHVEEHTEPLVQSHTAGLLWGAVSERKDGVPVRIHVYGPVTPIDLSEDRINKTVRNAQIPPRWRPKLIRKLQQIPLYSLSDFFRQILILHYCVTGEKLMTADIAFRSEELDNALTGDSAKQDLPGGRDRTKTWKIEQALMNMVSQGDLNYKEILSKAGLVSKGVDMGTTGTLEQVRVTQIVFISLCTRAAIKGGVLPEEAYTRGDAYIRDAMSCRTIADLANIGHGMYEDFIRMVRKRKYSQTYSKQIQDCCDYIQLHSDGKVSISDVANFAGYTDYYFSRKFKEETGKSVQQYIKEVKVERAKTLLLSTDLSIQEISDRLSFGSRSHFAESFREIAGIPPAAYRASETREDTH